MTAVYICDIVKVIVFVWILLVALDFMFKNLEPLGSFVHLY